ncbi:hypothetical protein P170DRAFT_383111 [Aspergillus steynii IBT 23096]|uniref:Uncharacterized protein n=1 Tax=Aspergillus steynii IBT 23096 TaxID=1392250 RepID=A0A2I2G7F1_9EURO|nr:uncharacterized protein P170DRAFT_383111 [Aspergillus steynii IBT 23096]PLB48805.1 hypothetical protein P170DRAFT_383111 [Aspergillus steynii IBT 23096]
MSSTIGYYNGTAEFKLTPLTDRDYDEPPCEPLRNISVTSSWNSILSIIEPGSKNIGSNPVNLVLNSFLPNYDWSKSPRLGLLWGNEGLLWPLLSAIPTWSNESTTDNFNLTSSKASSAFHLSGMVNKGASSSSFPMSNFSFPACNSSMETGNWTVELQVGKWPLTKGWSGFRLPTTNTSFNDRTANVSISGIFRATAWLHTNASRTLAVGSSILGSLELEFRGILDPYHSDVLDMDSPTPKWLRTVGFGNNSLNIDNDATSAAATSWALRGGSIIVLPVLSLILNIS